MKRKGKLAAAALIMAGAMVALGCALGCAPRHEAMVLPATPAAMEGMEMPTEFAMDITCTGCHSEAAEAMQQTGFTGANHATQECVSCHNDEQGLVAAHASRFDAEAAGRVVALTKSQVDPETCYTCHGSMEELAAATADSAVLTDKQGKTVNPHDLPEGHFGANVTCGSCHKMHSATETATSAQNSCIGCHHDSVYECGTCHAV